MLKGKSDAERKFGSATVYNTQFGGKLEQVLIKRQLSQNNVYIFYI